MRKFALWFVIVSLLFTSISFFGNVDIASATQRTYEIYDNYDAYVWHTDAVYATCHDDSTGTDATYISKSAIVGQYFDSSDYFVYRSVLLFNTQDLPYDASITEAKVHLYGRSDSSGTDFDVTLVEINYSDLSTPINIYDYGTIGLSDTSLGTVNTSGWTTADYNEISLNATGRSLIQRDGITTFGVKSSRDIASNTPSGAEYVEFWTSEKGISGTDNYMPYMEITYTVPALGTPNPFEIRNVSVFNGYQKDDDGNTMDDALFVIEYYCSYGSAVDGETEYVPEDYFSIRISDVSGVQVQTKLPRWGYAVASIYLNEDSITVLPEPGIGETYTVDIYGNPDKFSPNISSDGFDIDYTAWKGENLGLLDAACVSAARRMETYYGEDLLINVGGADRLNSLGATIFEDGIHELSSVRPNLFQVVKIDSGITNREHTQSYSGGPSGAFGTSVMTAFNNLGDYFGVGGTFLAAAFWCFIMLIVVGVAVLASGNSTVGILVALPILFIGNYLGVVPLVLTALIAVGMAGFAFHSLWLQKT